MRPKSSKSWWPSILRQFLANIVLHKAPLKNQQYVIKCPQNRQEDSNFLAIRLVISLLLLMLHVEVTSSNSLIPFRVKYSSELEKEPSWKKTKPGNRRQPSFLNVNLVNCIFIMQATLINHLLRSLLSIYELKNKTFTKSFRSIN